MAQDSYLSMVDNQLVLFRRGSADSNVNPFLAHPRYYEEKYEQKPWWAVGLRQKQEYYISSMMTGRVEDNELTLIEWNVPRQFGSLGIEREFLLDHADNQVVIERLYGYPHDSYTPVNSDPLAIGVVAYHYYVKAYLMHYYLYSQKKTVISPRLTHQAIDNPGEWDWQEYFQFSGRYTNPWFNPFASPVNEWDDSA
jgi:hypothetical protein